ncbi:hypothetical protein L211DRAFT_556767 [Terfezia boudieri ATCC MYA-4762]|uniref:Uncharacterized protein n=1 Tax=Terfezia boudieri ATCC MYA-4762 TaxID=1051890 RepID=A0A3N4M2H3_9PEZI|nr:hypothetical protein L211DRAFT_556767 [Terfezia boudieri ATCC MYA-4762]
MLALPLRMSGERSMVERRPKFGFCSMARFRRVANPFGRWRPVVPASDCGLLRQVGLEDHTRVYLMEVASEKGSRQGHYRRQSVTETEVTVHSHSRHSVVQCPIYKPGAASSKHLSRDVRNRGKTKADGHHIITSTIAAPNAGLELDQKQPKFSSFLQQSRP